MPENSNPRQIRTFLRSEQRKRRETRYLEGWDIESFTIPYNSHRSLPSSEGTVTMVMIIGAIHARLCSSRAAARGRAQPASPHGPPGGSNPKRAHERAWGWLLGQAIAGLPAEQILELRGHYQVTRCATLRRTEPDEDRARYCKVNMMPCFPSELHLQVHCKRVCPCFQQGLEGNRVSLQLCMVRTPAAKFTMYTCHSSKPNSKKNSKKEQSRRGSIC